MEMGKQGQLPFKSNNDGQADQPFNGHGARVIKSDNRRPADQNVSH